MSSFQPKQHLKESAQFAQRLLSNDLKATPDDKLHVGHGGCSRTPLNIVAECAMVNGLIAGFLSTGKFEGRPSAERAAHLNSVDTREKALAYLEEETQRLVAAIDAMDESTLGEVTDGPIGRPMTRFAIAGLASTHMMYHDGQLNYVQSICGDSEMHWG